MCAGRLPSSPGESQGVEGATSDLCNVGGARNPPRIAIQLHAEVAPRFSPHPDLSGKGA